jgi:hypothetical protein
MPGPEVAQYGLAVFAVAGLIYLVDRWIKQKGDNDLAEVVQNNTKAMENLTTDNSSGAFGLYGRHR